MFCDSCTSQRIRLPEFDYVKEERVCEACFKRQLGRQSKVSAAPPVAARSSAHDDDEIAFEPF